MNMLRLQKYIADSGVCSRRKAEKLIAAGLVKVNGKTAIKPGTKVIPQKDQVEVEGKVLTPRSKKVYIALNKPKGVEVTCAKGHSVADFLKIPERVFPIGRLDKDSSGLLLLTNDGDFANKIMHPRYEHQKEYYVETDLPPGPEKIQRLQAGILILGKITSPAKIRALSPASFLVAIHEGKNRQIRRMFEAVGITVVSLTRTRIGKLKLGDLPAGHWKRFKPEIFF